MKKFLSVLLSLAIITATPSTGLCLSKENKQSEERVSASWQAVKETCKEVANVIYDNAVLISAIVAGTTLTSVSAFNGVKNRAEISKILSNKELNNRTKAVKIVKILLLGKRATAEKEIIDPVEESTNTTEPPVGNSAEDQANKTEAPAETVKGSTNTTETSTDKSVKKSNNTKETKDDKSEKNQKRRHGTGFGI